MTFSENDRLQHRAAMRAAPERQGRKHKWVDVRGWGGAQPGTLQCDYCDRLASPTDPKREVLISSECERKR